MPGGPGERQCNGTTAAPHLHHIGTDARSDHLATPSCRPQWGFDTTAATLAAAPCIQHLKAQALAEGACDFAMPDPERTTR